MITLYKKGNTHIVRGVICELRKFGNNELDYALSIGYITDPKKIDEKVVRAATKETCTSSQPKKKVTTLKKG